MAKCRLCDHENLPNAERCEKCGVRFDPEPDAAPDDVAAEPAAEDAPAEECERRVLAELKGGRKIAAIKIYRQQHGGGLKEAKDAVESLAREHGVEPAGGGCAGAALVFLLAIGAMAGAVAWV